MWNWLTRGSGSEARNEGQGVSEVRELLRGLKSRRAEPSPFFAKRVMAAINATEAELARRTRAWAAVPAFASRLSAIAAILLVAAGTWLFSGSYRPSALSGGIFEDSAAAAASSSQDDVFTIQGEEAR
jgi:hypothetical protein